MFSDSPELNELGTHNSIHDSSPDFARAIENVTVALGREAILSCSVTDLGNYKVNLHFSSDVNLLQPHTPSLPCACRSLGLTVFNIGKFTYFQFFALVYRFISFFT